MKTATENWNVSDLLDSQLRRALFWVKTLKTFKSRRSTMSTICSTELRPGREPWSWSVDDLLDRLSRKDEHHVRWLVHQLFRRLRLTERRARRAGWQGDLGHCDNLLRNRRIVGLEHGHQLVHHLRHRNIQHLNHGSEVGKLLHGVLPDLLLWPPRLTQAEWPGTAGLFLMQLEELWLGGGFSRNVAVLCCSFPPTSPVLPLTLRGVVLFLGTAPQRHSDVRADGSEPSLAPPSSGAGAVNIHHHVDS